MRAFNALNLTYCVDAQKVRLAKTIPHFSTWQEERDAELECALVQPACLHLPLRQIDWCSSAQHASLIALMSMLLLPLCTTWCGQVASLLQILMSSANNRAQKLSLGCKALLPGNRRQMSSCACREAAVSSARERAEELSLEHRARGASQYRLANIMAKYMEDIDEEVRQLMLKLRRLDHQIMHTHAQPCLEHRAMGLVCTAWPMSWPGTWMTSMRSWTAVA